MRNRRSPPDTKKKRLHTRRLKTKVGAYADFALLALSPAERQALALRALRSDLSEHERVEAGDKSSGRGMSSAGRSTPHRAPRSIASMEPAFECLVPSVAL